MQHYLVCTNMTLFINKKILIRVCFFVVRYKKTVYNVPASIYQCIDLLEYNSLRKKDCIIFNQMIIHCNLDANLKMK